MAWCAERGLRVVSLQHDGIVIDALPDGLSAEEAAELMSSAASRAAGYEVVVEAKGIAMPQQHRNQQQPDKRQHHAADP